MNMTVQGNARTANKAREGLAAALAGIQGWRGLRMKVYSVALQLERNGILTISWKASFKHCPEKSSVDSHPHLSYPR